MERAKTGDLLKAKIQQRPDRQELERRHILETHESHIDPSLADKYRMLEKAILVDQLNSKISHRPGPLELIEKNILHADEPIERIVKNGLVTFKTTLEDEEIAASSNFVPLEDDSTQSSEGDAQVQHQHVQILQQVQPVHKVPQIHHQVIKTEPDEQMYHHIVNANMLEAAATSAGIINIQVALPTHEIREIQAPIINFFQNLQNQQNQINLQNAQQSVQNVQIVPPPPPLPIKTETITYHVKQISQPILQSHQIPKVEPQKSSFIPVMEPKHRIDQNMQQNVHSPGSVSSSMSPASSIASPGPILPNKNSIASFLQSNQKYSAPGKDKNRKKSKSKPMSKLRAIKFHEYKGPPNSKGGSSSGSNGNSSKKTGETNYELILQQQCLLEYLEGIYKPPHQIQPKMKVEMGEEPVQQHQHTMKFHDSSALTEKHNLVMNRPPASNTLQKAQVTIFPSPAVSSSTNISNNIVAAPVVTTTITDIAKLNKMKVSDLKAQLKKLNLPVSGPKPLLVERLKPFLPFETATAPSSVASTTSAMAPSTVNIEEETISSNNSHNSNISHELDHFNSSLHSQQSQHSVSSESDVDFMEVQNSPAPPTHYMQMPSNLSNISNISSVSNISNISNISVTEEDIVREQQRKIEELQRQLQQSQLELEQMKQHQLPESEHGSPTNMQDIEGDEEPEPLQFAQIDVKAENQAIYSPTPANFLPPKETKNFLIFENNQFNNINNRSNLNSQTPMFLVQEEKPEPSISNNVGIISPPTMVEKAPSQSPKLLRIENPPMYKLAAKEKKLMMSHEIQVIILFN